jgi:hypothetical protein
MQALGSPANEAHAEGLVMFTAKKWPVKETIRWYFMDGPEWAKQQVFDLACRWLDVANLKFERTEDRESSDVRVTFNASGSWSYLGTDNRLIPKDEATMALGWLLDVPQDFEEWRRVVVHEAGHMMDFGHEHQHPRRAFEWNEANVYADYQREQGWSREEVYRQVIRTYSELITQFSNYNKFSIMEYSIPERHVLDPEDAVGWNTSRSTMDKRYAGLWYPYYPEAAPDTEAA